MVTSVILDSWDETSQSVMKEMLKHFPNLEKFYRIGEGVLCQLEHPKPKYQLGFVFSLEDLLSGKKETMIYYPIKNTFIHHFTGVRCKPINEVSPFIRTKRGNMKITEFDDGKFGLSFVLVK